jgi:hypothetical protein
MTTTAQNIAAKFNVLESTIVRVEEWANVMFAVIKGIGSRFVSKKLKVEEKMEQFIELDTYRKKGINAYLVATDESGKALSYVHNMYGKPKAGQEDAAHKSKKHTILVRIDNLPDGNYIYKEAGGADFNKSRYGTITIKNGEII